MKEEKEKKLADKIKMHVIKYQVTKEKKKKR
jgi:hypothetical protein